MSIMPIDDNLRGAFEQLQNGTAFDRSLETRLSAVTGISTDLRGQAASLPTSINGVPSDIVTKARSIQASLVSAQTRLPSITTQITAKYDNLANDITIFASSQSLKNALGSGRGGCSSMGSFFGSLTTEGPAIVRVTEQLLNQALQEVSSFSTLATQLQQRIGQTSSTLLSQLDAQIAGNPANIAALQAVRQTIQNDFQTALPEARIALLDQARTLLPTNSQSALQTLRQEMIGSDFSVARSAERIFTQGTKIDTSLQRLATLVAGEQAALEAATNELETFGQAMSMQSLYSSNPCVQSLMGFVGNTSFVRKLGG